jgi:hypothetical protein
MQIEALRRALTPQTPGHFSSPRVRDINVVTASYIALLTARNNVRLDSSLISGLEIAVIHLTSSHVFYHPDLVRHP